MPLFLILFPLQHGKRSALQNKQVVILRMAFRARKVLGTFEKRAPGLKLQYCIDNAFHLPALPVRFFVHQQIRILAFYMYI